jgi:hypothetical protein
MGVGTLANILGDYRCQVTAADAQAIREHPAGSGASTVCDNQLLTAGSRHAASRAGCA